MVGLDLGGGLSSPEEISMISGSIIVGSIRERGFSFFLFEVFPTEDEMWKTVSLDDIRGVVAFGD